MKNIHGKNIEDGALQQFDECTAHDFVLESALMPDAHQGYVAPIGAVIKTRNAVVPAWVGYDIGCGMIAVLLSEEKSFQDSIKEKATELFNQVNRDIPMGAGNHNHKDSDVGTYATNKILDAGMILEKNVPNDELLHTVEQRTMKNLGTLGSGNHFIEILSYEDETWLVIHSGSRGVGHYIGTHFMKEVSGKDKGFEDTYAIQDEETKVRYMAYQDYCLEFALLNRMDMAERVARAIKQVIGVSIDVHEQLWTNKNHNHCVLEEGSTYEDDDVYIHRKGATTSEEGERGVIPANMRDGCFLVIGKGNEDFICSSSHGAGRAMSRGQARKEIKMETFKEQMEGITAPVKEKVIDESPDAYKNIFEVMALQEDSVEIVKHLKPIINWKGF